MKYLKPTTLALLFVSSSVFAFEDSIRNVLVVEPIPSPVWDPWPTPNPFEIDLTGWLWYNYDWIYYPEDYCENDYYENGVLRYEPSCKDGLLHGKVRSWDKLGRKIEESTYYEGKLYKRKNYSNGYISSIYHYGYLAGKMHQHGSCITYQDDYKTVSNYSYDTLLTVKKWYKKEFLVEYQHYDSNGLLDTLIKMDSTGLILATEYYHNGEKEGCWITLNEPPYKNVSCHNLDEVTYKSFRGNQKMRESLFINEKNSWTKEWYPDGKLLAKTNYDSSGTIAHTIQFDTNGFIIGDKWEYERRYYKSGFWSHSTNPGVFYHYETYDTSLTYIPYKRWIIKNGDTLREEYVSNSIIGWNSSIYSNNYEPDSNGTYVRHGRWVNYFANNYSSSVLSYNYGKREGRTVIYAINGGYPAPETTGYYKNDLKDSLWTTTKDSMTTFVHYKNGLYDGVQMGLRDSTDTLYFDTYLAGVLHGASIAYHQNGRRKASGNFLNNQKGGYWEYYDYNGRLIESGNYNDGEKVGKWYITVYNGEAVSITKIKYPKRKAL